MAAVLTKAPTDMAHIAADRLQGSSLSMLDIGPEFEEMKDNAEFCAVLDQLVFCCDTCDNWFEQNEMAECGDWICESCA